MPGVLHVHLHLHVNTFASKTRHAVVAAAAASARHHGRTPSSTAAIASIARNRSSYASAGGVIDGQNKVYTNTNTAANESISAGRKSHGGGGGGSSSGTRRSVSSVATSPPPPSSRSTSRSTSRSSLAPETPPPGNTAVAVARSPPSLLAPAASAFSSSSLLAPSAAAYTGMGINGGGRAARVDAVVVGAGQAGLSVAYHLQKAGGLRVVTLDANEEPGGAWRHRWPSLELFSTRKWSSLPGYPMFANAACEDGYPTTGEMAMYMAEYESVMNLNVVRPVKVTGVTQTTMGTFLVETDCLLGGTVARWEARTVISAAGTHASPVWPRLPGSETFRGTQIHSSQYRCADDFRGKRVAVVGAGNSGAQILAEVSAAGVASSALWSTLEKPSFLPIGLSGKEIFDTVALIRQRQGFVREGDIPSLRSIIMQPGIIEAAERGAYDQHVPAFTRLTPTGVAWEASPDGAIAAGHADVDAIIWCTGYRSNTSHLARLGLVREDSTVAMEGSEMGETEMPGVFAVGYGNWAGVGSGSIPGSTVYAKRAAAAAVQHLRSGGASLNSYDSPRSRLAVEPPAMATSSVSMGGSNGGKNGSSSSSSRAWPTAGRASARAVRATPGAGAVPSYGEGRQEQERVSVAA